MTQPGQQGVRSCMWNRPLCPRRKAPLSLWAQSPITFARISISNAGNTEGLRLEAHTVIDDGAVIYLNGNPVLWIGMDANAVIGYSTGAARTVGDANNEGPFPISTTNLVAGDNLLAVEVHQSSSGSSDIVFGMALDAVLTTTNTTTDRISVVLNEVLASNLTLTNNEELTSDWVELYNPDTNSVDLADLSLSNDTATPRRWVFPPGSIVPGKGYLLIQFDDSLPASSANTGFNLKAGGDGVYLFDKPARDRGLLDSVVFGIQVGDFSIGRLDAGTGGWTLTLPTPVADNIAAALGEVSALRINEWMADPAQGDDWFELYNPNAQAVELSGLYLTDDLNKRTQYRIPPLSFVGYGPQAFLKFTADGTQGQSADHVNFKLAVRRRGHRPAYGQWRSGELGCFRSAIARHFTRTIAGWHGDRSELPRHALTG